MVHWIDSWTWVWSCKGSFNIGFCSLALEERGVISLRHTIFERNRESRFGQIVSFVTDSRSRACCLRTMISHWRLEKEIFLFSVKTVKTVNLCSPLPKRIVDAWSLSTFTADYEIPTALMDITDKWTKGQPPRNIWSSYSVLFLLL